MLGTQPKMLSTQPKVLSTQPKLLSTQLKGLKYLAYVRAQMLTMWWRKKKSKPRMIPRIYAKIKLILLNLLV
jgi:hypothetical protein